MHHEKLCNHTPLGVTSRVRISVTEYQYVVHVMMREVERGDMEKSSAVSKLHYIFRKFATDSQDYKFCPGLDPERQREIVRFDLKSVRKMSECIESVKCLLWFQLRNQPQKNERKQVS